MARGGPDLGAWAPLFWVKKDEITEGTEGREARRTSKTKPPPPPPLLSPRSGCATDG